MKKTYWPACFPVTTVFVLILGTAGVCAARGNGIKAGDGRLHPSIDLDLTYDTNPGYFRSGDANFAGDLVLRIRPGLTLSFPSEAVAFDLSGKVGYDRYFGVTYTNTRDLSSVVGEADLRLGFNPNGQVSFFIEDVFSRTGDPRYTSLGAKFNRTDNEGKAHLQIKPGGGALMFDLAYGFFLDQFDQTSGVDNIQALSSYAHRIYFSGKWKFLPKTAWTVDFDSDLRRYPNSYSDGSKNTDVNAIRATVGMLGQITPTMSVVVKAGYGDTLLPSGYAGDDFRSVIGQFELTFQPGTTFVQLGYLRSFQPVVLFAYFGQDRIYARFKQQIAGKFTFAANVGFDFLGYGKAVSTAVPAGSSTRSDQLLAGDVSFDYHIQDWVSVGIAYNFQAVFSDYVQPLAGAGGVEYNKHAFTLHIGLDY